jgi:hypothetical protein
MALKGSRSRTLRRFVCLSPKDWRKRMLDSSLRRMKFTPNFVRGSKRSQIDANDPRYLHAKGEA